MHVAGVAGWRIILAIGSLGAVYVLLVQHRLPESPRWLLAQGRTADAHAALRRFAEGTGVRVPEHFANRPSRNGRSASASALRCCAANRTARVT